MKSQILDLSQIGVEPMSRFEMIEMNGGDVDGLMRAPQPDYTAVLNGARAVVNFVAGFFGL